MQKRRLERTELGRTIVVHDIVHQRTVGEVANINIEGLMLLADATLESGAILQVSLQLPQPISGHNTVELSVDCLWCRPADHTKRYWAGCQIIDASPEAVKLVEMLIREYGKD